MVTRTGALMLCPECQLCLGSIPNSMEDTAVAPPLSRHSRRELAGKRTPRRCAPRVEEATLMQKNLGSCSSGLPRRSDRSLTNQRLLYDGQFRQSDVRLGSVAGAHERPLTGTRFLWL